MPARAGERERRTRPTKPPRLDAANLAGLTSLMNPQHLRPDLDLAGAEKAVMGKTAPASRKRAAVDPVALFNAEIHRLSAELNLDLRDEAPAPPPREARARPAEDAGWQAPGPRAGPARAAGPTRAEAPPPEARAAPRGPVVLPHGGDLRDVFDELGPPAEEVSAESSGEESEEPDRDSAGSTATASDDEEAPAPRGRSESTNADDTWDGDRRPYERRRGESTNADDTWDGDRRSSERRRGEEAPEADGCRACRDECDSRCDCECHDEGAGVDAIIAQLERDIGLAPDRAEETRRRRLGPPEGSGRPGGERPRRPGGDGRRAHIDGVLARMRGEAPTPLGAEREGDAESRSAKLNQIAQLRQILEEEDIDCSAVPMPTDASPMKLIDDVLGSLRLKNDGNRASTLAEELVLGAAEGLESVFDGSRAIPVLGWKPDYTGVSSTVNAKLHRMRYETAQVVGGVMKKLNLGDGSRIALELVPGLLLYPHMRAKQRGAPSLAREMRVADARGAYSGIRRMEDPGRVEADLGAMRNL